MTALANALERAERNRMAIAKHGPANRTWVYFIAAENGTVKIGKSINVRSRLGSLQGSTASQLRLLGTVDAALYSEPHLHAKFRHLRLRGEWFRCTPEITAFIAEHSG